VSCLACRNRPKVAPAAYARQGPGTARRCRAPIRTGHPGFDLAPLVIDSATIPDPGLEAASPELVVLAVLTGALDLGQDSARRLVLARLADLDASRLATYTVLSSMPRPSRPDRRWRP